MGLPGAFPLEPNMAYRDQPSAHPFDSAYYARDQSPEYNTRPRSRASTSASDHQPRETSPAWDRGSVDSGSQPNQQPFKHAFRHAFDKSEAARVVDPDLIAQITAEVKRSVLDEIKSGVMAGTTQPQAVPSSGQHWVPPSPPSTSNSIPPRDVYTPPSPKHTDFSSQQSPDRDPLHRDPLLDGSSDTPTPRFERSAPVNIPQERTTRPGPAPRMATEDYTPIEKMWQRLFDPEGQPLPRLGQLLRGLALHLIEDYEPKFSLVISPAKMLKFYEQVKLKDEIYPWQKIFGQVSYSALSKIYRDMRCQHHLIQEHPAEQPYIPALTPQGFQEWMTAMIQAYPDAEYERMTKAILDMPISNADDRKERFPKELPRRMFPTVENLHAQQRCAAALSSEGVGPLKKAPSFPPPPPKTQGPPPGASFERERSPYSSKPEVRPFDFEEEPISSSAPIERERKPYSAGPGTGKTYKDDINPPDTAANEKRRRAQSTAGQAPPWSPPPQDAYHQQSYHARTGSSNVRPRSPSFSNFGTQSDPSIRDIPSSYYASNIHNVEEDVRRYSKDSDPKRGGRHRSGTSGLDGSFDSQPRSVYDDDEYRGRGGSNGYEGRGYDSRRY